MAECGDDMAFDRKKSLFKSSLQQSLNIILPEKSQLKTSREYHASFECHLLTSIRLNFVKVRSTQGQCIYSHSLRMNFIKETAKVKPQAVITRFYWVIEECLWWLVLILLQSNFCISFHTGLRHSSITADYCKTWDVLWRPEITYTLYLTPFVQIGNDR